MNQKFESFGNYILLEKLATGGMAEVFLCRKLGADGIGKFCAIKRILPQFADSPEFIDMFRDEAKIAINLGHSNIVTIHEFGVESNQFYIVMDYVEGRNLRQVLNKMKKSNSKFAVDQIVYIIKEVAAGLDHAHRCLDETTGKPLNITHRDMSPQNVMLSFEGEVKIVDFGIAKAESQMETTRAGTLKGKFGYMSPEQAEGQTVDLRTDIFSLGTVLWELLANDRLFIANNEINTLRKIRDCQVPSLRKMNPNIPTELDRIVQKALARDRNLRYQTAAALHRDLSRFLNRQYPDFSPHDFSVYIKTIFQDEILNARKRLIEYANLSMKEGLVVSTQAGSETDAIISGTQTTSFVSEASKKSSTSSQKWTSTNNQSLSMATKSKTNEISGFENKDKIETSTSSKGSPALDKAAENLTSATQYFDRQDKATVLDEDALSKGLKKDLGETSKVYSFVDESYKEFTRSSIRKRKSKKSKRRDKSRSSRRSKSEKQASFSSAALIFGLLISTYALAVKFLPVQMRPVISVTDPLLSPLHRLVGVSPSSDLSSRSPGSKDTREDQIAITAQQPTPPMGTEDTPTPSTLDKGPAPAAVGEAEIVVSSSPSGAEIYIDGKNTRFLTPSKVTVPTGTPFSIELKKTGYIDYLQEQLNVNDVGVKYSATLQKALIGFLDIDVKPPGNSRVYINGQLLKEDRLPIHRYPVPANTNVRIKAENPALGLSHERMVNVGPDRRTSIYIDLRNSSRTPAKQ
ncbi:MAG: serine/threonine protein kinase [Bdellovibrionales bacterium]|nr:serine/threonine protein kinase [Bdellovibrionales bacterium]